MEASAKIATTESNSFGELFYRVLTPPASIIEPLSCRAEKESVYIVAQKLAPWLHRNRSVKLIRIIQAEAVGRWAEDMQFLLEIFPNATFEVHVPLDCLAETGSLVSSRITIYPIKNRWKWWFANAVRTIVSRPGPLVLLSGSHDEQKRYAGIISMLGLGSDSIVAPTMNQFILALRMVNNGEDTKKGAIAKFDTGILIKKPTNV